MAHPLVSILIPNYKTHELTKLCLRLLRKFTDPTLAKVIVIDNDSQDDSLSYLRSLSWIELLERRSVPNESPVQSHARALDLALSRVETPYVLSIHTDTLVKNKDWLPFLITKIQEDESIAGVGSWKLESKPLYRQALKTVEHYAQRFYFALIGKTHHGLAGVGKNYYYLRSHCAMYRMDLIRKYNLHFADGDMVAGKAMHKALVDAGYSMRFLASDELIKYLDHINHATSVLNPKLSSRETSVRKGLNRIEKSLAKLQAAKILRDDRLDR